MMLLENLNAQSLNYWLSRFVVEIRRNNGNPHPPTSISIILVGLYQYCKALVWDGREACPIGTEEEEEDTLWRNVVVNCKTKSCISCIFELNQVTFTSIGEG